MLAQGFSRGDYMALLMKTLKKKSRKQRSSGGQDLSISVHVALTLVMRKSTFRGRRKSRGDANKGHFLSAVKLLAKRDDLVQKQVIHLPTVWRSLVQCWDQP